MSKKPNDLVVSRSYQNKSPFQPNKRKFSNEKNMNVLLDCKDVLCIVLCESFNWSFKLKIKKKKKTMGVVVNGDTFSST